MVRVYTGRHPQALRDLAAELARGYEGIAKVTRRTKTHATIRITATDTPITIRAVQYPRTGEWVVDRT